MCAVEREERRREEEISTARKNERHRVRRIAPSDKSNRTHAPSPTNTPQPRDTTPAFARLASFQRHEAIVIIVGPRHARRKDVERDLVGAAAGGKRTKQKNSSSRAQSPKEFGRLIETLFLFLLCFFFLFFHEAGPPDQRKSFLLLLATDATFSVL